MRNNANDRERQDYLSQKGLQVVASGANTKGSTGSSFWCQDYLSQKCLQGLWTLNQMIEGVSHV